MAGSRNGKVLSNAVHSSVWPKAGTGLVEVCCAQDYIEGI